MAISRNQLVKELEPGLNALFGLEYKQYENQSAEIYTTESSDRAFEEEVMLSGFAQAQLFIMGVSRDPDHSDTTVEGFALRVQIREHILIGNDTQRAGI